MVQLSQASRPAVFEVDSIDEHGRMLKTSIAGEHPLTLYLDKRELVTLMTLGAEPEYLSLGYLRNQRFVDSPQDLASIQVDWDSQAVAVTSRLLADTGISLWEQEGNQIAGKMAHRTVTTGCGQGTVFGGLMDEVDNIRLPVHGRLTQAGLLNLLEQMRGHDSIYRVAGAVHGCALFELDGGTATSVDHSTAVPELKCFVEDVGRHNAVDAIAGWMWVHQGPRNAASPLQIFYTTGRLTSEMVIKAAQMGIAILVSRSGLTHMGLELARQMNMTLIGRCQGRHFLLLSGAERFVSQPALAGLAKHDHA